MSRNTTETSTVRFSSSVALGFRSRSFLTASGTNFDSSPLSCSSSASRWRDSWRFWSAVSSSLFLVASSVWAWASRDVMSLNAPPSSPISSRAWAGARASKSPSPMRRATAESATIGRTTTELIATVKTAAAARMVSTAMRIWRFRWRRTSPKTGSIEVATRTTARTW